MKKITVKDLRKFINQMEIEGLNDETVLTFETKRSSGCIENITSMEYSPTTNILIFSKAMEEQKYEMVNFCNWFNCWYNVRSFWYNRVVFEKT